MAETPEEIAREIIDSAFYDDTNRLKIEASALRDAIVAALSRVRAEAIEEAAKIADAHKGCEHGEDIASRMIAAAIRSLAGKAKEEPDA